MGTDVSSAPLQNVGGLSGAHGVGLAVGRSTGLTHPVGDGSRKEYTMTSEFKYQHRSAFDSVLLRLTGYELEQLDAFFEQSKTSLRSEKKELEQRAERSGGGYPDDFWVDDVARLEEFAWLSSEFAIVGLWRCVELYRKDAIKHALGDDDTIRSFLGRRKSKRPFPFNHKNFVDILAKLKIEEGKIRCAKSVDELRRLNNAIKHARRVNDSLAEIPRWKGKKGDRLGDLERHYSRLQPYAKKYLEDLAKRLKAKFPPPHRVK